MSALHRHRLLAVTAAFAVVWMIARAAVQSITIDEADTYLVWAARPDPSHWEPGSNNHILNSVLIRLTTSVFGPSHLTMRAPALLGGIVYVLVCCWLSVTLMRARVLCWALFVCLVFNPFAFDYLVAARGYSLAIAFLTCAIALLIAMQSGCAP